MKKCKRDGDKAQHNWDNVYGLQNLLGYVI